MGKRKIGEIYNKPIVEGDKNLVTNNEIHKSELSGGSGGGDCENMYISYNKDNTEDFGAFMFASLYGALWKGVPNNGGEKVIANFYIIEQLGGIVAEAAMIPISEKTRNADGKLMTYKDMVAEMESSGVSFHRITKEEFYSLS